MATQLSKAGKIRKLLHLGTAEIAKRVGCREEYVRAVRQRTSMDGRPIEAPTDKVWRLANLDRVREKHRVRQATRYANDPEFRRRQLEGKKRSYHAKRRAEALAS